MRKIVIIFAIIVALAIAVFKKAPQPVDVSADAYLRDRIVKLQGERGFCSGVEVKSPKGRVYTLTAGHCRALLDANHRMIAIDEYGRKTSVRLVKEDLHSDLLLLTGTDGKFVEIADSIYPHERVKAITHGHAWDAFRTDGELVQEEIVMIPEEPILSAADFAECVARAPKMKPMQDMTGEAFCVITVPEMISTTYILPGSSGGPLFDMSGKIVGIVSAGTSEDIFGRFVRLSDIQAFLRHR